MTISKFVWFWQRREYHGCTVVMDGSCPFLKIRADKYISPNDNVPEGWFLTDVLFRRPQIKPKRT